MSGQADHPSDTGPIAEIWFYDASGTMHPANCIRPDPLGPCVEGLGDTVNDPVDIIFYDPNGTSHHAGCWKQEPLDKCIGFKTPLGTREQEKWISTDPVVEPYDDLGLDLPATEPYPQWGTDLDAGLTYQSPSPIAHQHSPMDSLGWALLFVISITVTVLSLTYLWRTIRASRRT